MSDPKKEGEKIEDASARALRKDEKESGDLPDDLKRGPEPEGDVEKLVERGRQMGF